MTGRGLASHAGVWSCRSLRERGGGGGGGGGERRGGDKDIEVNQVKTDL